MGAPYIYIYDISRLRVKYLSVYQKFIEIAVIRAFLHEQSKYCQ